jgi:hypothetical protein
LRRYKRNQVEEAIATALGRSGEEAVSELRIRIKRLLDADRTLGREITGRGPGEPYAFYTGKAPGSGLEVWFSPYEAFALIIGLLLLRHGWPQRMVVRIMRLARPTLEPEHARILSLPPETLFDQAEVIKRARPGMISVDVTDPVFLAIATREGAEHEKADLESPPHAVSVCRGHEGLMSFMRQSAPIGMSMTSSEVAGPAHILAHHLQQTKPRARGRTSR